MTTLLNARGRPRPTPTEGRAMWDHEIEPGRSVVNNWDRALFEPWAQRKARIAAERAEASTSKRGRP